MERPQGHGRAERLERRRQRRLAARHQHGQAATAAAGAATGMDFDYDDDEDAPTPQAGGFLGVGRAEPSTPGAAGSSAPLAAGAKRLAAAGGGGGRRGGANDASRLAEKMRRKAAKKSNATDCVLSARENTILTRYAPYAADIFQAGGAAAAAPTTGLHFDKHTLLPELIGNAHANFFKIDRELSDDHAIATSRLHASVFRHANDFLLLFRDVDKASRLVEALKTNVQGTKTAISSISKFTYSNMGNVNGRAAAASGRGAAGMMLLGTAAGAGGAGANSDSTRLRPSLVTRCAVYCPGGSGANLMDSEDSGPYRSSAETSPGATSSSFLSSRRTGMSGAPAAAAVSGLEHAASVGGGGGGGGGGGSFTSGAHASTRSLAVASVYQWRYMVGISAEDNNRAVAAASGLGVGADGGSGDQRQPSAFRGAGAAQSIAKSAAAAEERSREIQLFVDVLREEAAQLLAERKHIAAAQLLRSIASDASSKHGCLPLLLDLEGALVLTVARELHQIPMTPLYRESVHVPLVQLLLRFGRHKTGSSMFLELHSPWLQAELRKLQARVGPSQASLIAADFLVRAMTDVLWRQHTLWLPLESALKLQAAHGGLLSGGGPGVVPSDAPPAVASATASATIHNSTVFSRSSSQFPPVPPLSSSSTGGPGAGAASSAFSSENSLTAPNSTALLWVRANIERFATEVLATHVLSYGTGTDGGDPSRIRRAARVMVQTVRVLQTLTRTGFSGCDTLTLRRLTPSMVQLESDFTSLTATRMENSGRAMTEQLITSALLMYDSRGEKYNPSACGDVARRSNLQSQDLLSVAKRVPPSSHAWLLQLLLSPASSNLFVRGYAPSFSSSLAPLSLARRSSGTEASTARGQKTAGAAGGENGAVRGNATPSSAGGVMLSSEQFSFLRYANGCTAIHELLASSLANFIAAIAGMDALPLMSDLDGAAAAGKKNLLGGSRHAGSPLSSPTISVAQAAAEAQRRQAAVAEHSASECASLLLGSALIMESVDVTMHRLLVAFLTAALRQQQTILLFLDSEDFTKRHRALFAASPSAAAGKRSPTSTLSATKRQPAQQQQASAKSDESKQKFAHSLSSSHIEKTVSSALVDSPLLANCAASPAWVLDAMLTLLSDVLGAATWTSYIARGDAVAQLLCDSSLGFRTQHVEELRGVMPPIVQAWLATVVLSGFSAMDSAKTLLLRGESRQDLKKVADWHAPVNGDGDKPYVTSTAPPVFSARPTPVVSSTQGSSAGAGAQNSHARGDGAVRDGVVHPRRYSRSSTIHNSFHNSPVSRDQTNGRVYVEVEGLDRNNAATAHSGTASSASSQQQQQHLSTGNAIALGNDRSVLLETNTASPLTQSRLLKVWMSMLDHAYTTPTHYTAHEHVVTSLPYPWVTSTMSHHTHLPPSSAPTSSSPRGAGAGANGNNRNDNGRAEEAILGVWCVRKALRSYPEFPIGGAFDRNDELFLFHWCVQISLNLISMFQERLLTPSYVMNARAAEEMKQRGGSASSTPLGDLKSNQQVPPPPQQQAAAVAAAARQLHGAPPVMGCISPQEDSALAVLCAGGGNYAAAVAFMQFTVAQLLRDGLCRADTWSAVYNCSAQEWRGSDEMFRQQLFFFAVFARMWSPLFTGGLRTPVTTTTTAAAAAATGSIAGSGGGGAASSSPVPVSALNVDALPSLALMEWMTCGGIIQLKARQTPSAASPAASLPFGAAPAFSSPPPQQQQQQQLNATHFMTAIDSVYASGEDAQTVASAAAAAAAATGKSLQQQPPNEKAAATHALIGTTGSYIPDTLLAILRYFFEIQLGETRAVPALTSEAMRLRVDCAMANINLLDYVGTLLGDEDSELEDDLGMDDDEADDDDFPDAVSTRSGLTSADRRGSSQRHGSGRASVGSPASSRTNELTKKQVTMKQLRELFSFYMTPLL